MNFSRERQKEKKVCQGHGKGEICRTKKSVPPPEGATYSRDKASSAKAKKGGLRIRLLDRFGKREDKHLWGGKKRA